ncbi:MAG: Gp138 family membrane-puncturing spike protein, partial [Myxococcota bacterium]
MGQRDEIVAVMQRVLDQWKRDLRVATPGQIRSYDPSAQTADVQPQIRRELRRLSDERERVFDDMPIIPNVPVCFPRFGPWFVSFPIADGDYCLLLVCDQDLTRWREQGRTGDPYMPSSHHISDAVAVPGLFPEAAALSDAHADHLVIGKDGGPTLHVTDDDVRVGGASAGKRVALVEDLEELKQAIASAGIT